MAGRNPFSPTFGAAPPVIAGRDDILDNIEDAFETGHTHPDYTTLFLGVRGSGKTVMLDAAQAIAQSKGWLTLSEDAWPTGLLGRLTRAAERLLGELDEDPSRRVRSVTAAGFGVEWEPVAPSTDGGLEAAEGLRLVLSVLGDALRDRGTGLIVTLDELLSADLDEIRQFGAVMQHVSRREKRPIAFAGAALPQFEEELESDDAATFLQRCSRYDMERLDDTATRLAISKPIEDRDAEIDPEALDQAVAASSGYAFMVQLVAFHTWAAAPDEPSWIGKTEVAKGIAEAQRRVGRLVLGPTWRGLSDVDRRFLIAMAMDDGESRLSEVASRLDVDVGYAGVYRQRLIRAGMIVSTGRGRIDLAHHAARDWIRARAQADGQQLTPDETND